MFNLTVDVVYYLAGGCCFGVLNSCQMSLALSLTVPHRCLSRGIVPWVHYQPTFHILNFHRCYLFRMVPPCSTQPKANLCNSAIRLDYEKNSFGLWTSCFSRKDRSHSFTSVLVRSFPSSGLFKVLVGTPLVELLQSWIYDIGSNLLFVVSSTLLLPVVKQNVPQWTSSKYGRLPISHGTVGDVFLTTISQIPSTIFIKVIFLPFSIAQQWARILAPTFMLLLPFNILQCQGRAHSLGPSRLFSWCIAEWGNSTVMI